LRKHPKKGGGAPMRMELIVREIVELIYLVRLEPERLFEMVHAYVQES
jgi:hypothetical protein